MSKATKIIYFLIIAILLGGNIYLFNNNLQLKKQISQTPKERIVEVKPKETKKDLLERCGDFPEEVTTRAVSTDRRFLALNGPFWAPDCRHIAWSSYYNFPGGWIGETDAENETAIRNTILANKANDGLFIWDYKTEKFTKISNDGVMINWENPDTLIFKSQDKTYSYDLIFKEIKEK